MKPQEKKAIAELITATALVYRQQTTPEMLRIYCNALDEYFFEDINKAFNVHLRKSKFFPTIAEIIELIPASQNTRHLGADEAWSLVLKSFDEFATVILTPEMLQAKSIAQDVWNTGDKIGARMAFKSSYTRLTDAATHKPQWQVSVGYDKEQRTDAINEALRLGRIDNTTAQRYLPDLRDAGPIAGLLTGSVQEQHVDDDLREKWSDIANLIARKKAKADAIETEEREERARKREEFEEKRRQAVAKAEQLMMESING